MNKQLSRPDVAQGVTQALAHRIATLRYEDLPADIIAIAKHCVLDWVAVAVQGTREPVATILAEQVAAEGGSDWRSTSSTVSPGLQSALRTSSSNSATSCLSIRVMS